MNIDTGLESSPRARPLSAGLWTLLSWLRREEHCSSESLSSVGSDRTTASFAFLAPPPPRERIAELPPTPVEPPTDSYRKRVHERNIRRQHERDLTLRSKYGLYRADNGYDALTLPSTRFIDKSNKENRERRATSATFERRVAHVPGKRRAPLPPTFIDTHPNHNNNNSLTRRRASRKRPAPKPPVKLEDQQKEIKVQHNSILTNSSLMNSIPGQEKTLLTDTSNDHFEKSEKHPKKTEKYPKKDGQAKLKTEKSFLKHLFESKKRNSTYETVPERILPNISELDKQAAAIIESCKLKALNEKDHSSSSNVDTWFCTRCLRKYDSNTVSCKNCLSEQKRNLDGLVLHAKPSDVYTQTQNSASSSDVASSSRISGIGADEKQKLKEMLKEMKNSIPKKPKHIKNEERTIINKANESIATLETPTLRIGAFMSEELKLNAQAISRKKPSDGYNIDKKVGNLITPKAKETVVITQHVVLVAPQNDEIESTETCTESKTTETRPKENPHSSANINHTPLKISSLLNPIYVPKIENENQVKRSLFFNQPDPQVKQVLEKQSSAIITNFTKPALCSANKLNNVTNNLHNKDNMDGNKEVLEKKSMSSSSCAVTRDSSMQKEGNEVPVIKHIDKSTHSGGNNNNVLLTVEQHSRRRDLINQLEKSIATGDEAAAADAAMKLAQLRLSCSVLSFSSQIVGESSKHLPEQEQNKPTIPPYSKNNLKSLVTTAKTDVAVQSMETVSENSKTKEEPTINALIKPNNLSSSREINAKSAHNSHLDTKEERQHPQTNRNQEPSTSKAAATGGHNDLTTIEIWVEDREATRGPIRLRISSSASMGDLRRQAEATLGLDSRLQRWIVGRTLCTDDKTPIVALAGQNLASPFYLCVVEEEAAATSKTEVKQNTSIDKIAGDVYSELVQLEQRALILNSEPFECGICMEECANGRGVILRECIHSFCTECLSDLVRYCEDASITCPAMGCPGTLQEREIRGLVSPEEYEKWLARGLAAAESGTRNAFHCRTRDCSGWALCDPGVRRFPCPVCKKTNCIPCEAIHVGETCEQFQSKRKAADEDSNKTDEGTETFLETLISKGEALRCPECSAVITKKWGCDWVKCSACKTEICWVTRGRRWGPGGRGDTSGGCRCGVEGKRCHPTCGYCH